MASSRANRLIALISGVLLLSACQGSSFTVSEVSLSHETRLVVSDERLVSDDSVMVLSFSTSTDDDYSYVLVSPSGDVSWDGRFSKVDGKYRSEELMIGSASSFEKGRYGYYIYSSKNQEKSGEVDLDYSTLGGPYFDENGFIEHEGLVSHMEMDKSLGGRIIGTDSYKNKVIIDRI